MIFLRPPKFWNRPGAWQVRFLQPFAQFYGERVANRMKRPGKRVSVPVICIGNFTLGGAGKTPLALAIADILIAAGQSPFFLTRGYGGSRRGPLIVPQDAEAGEVGDEALLLARKAPTIVSADRPAGAALAIEHGASIIIMDDGFQNPSLEKDCAIVAVDGEAGIGNGCIFPAGPLRAPIHAQMPGASAVVIIGAGDAGAAVSEFARGFGLDVFDARLALTPNAPNLRGRRVLAFSGIGRPEKFFKTLADMAAVIVGSEMFPDHHPFTERDAERILARARQEEILPVTTSKDMVRLTGGPARRALAAMAKSVPVELVFTDEQAVRDFLLKRFRLAG